MEREQEEAARIPVVDLRAVELLGPCKCPCVSGRGPAYHAVWCPHCAVTFVKEKG
jgi:hypothetical protein